VDDMLNTAKSMFEIKRLEFLLGDKFKMKDLGDAKKILGLGLLNRTHLNLSVLCDCVIFYSHILCFIRIPKISFVTTTQFLIINSKNSAVLGQFFSTVVSQRR